MSPAQVVRGQAARLGAVLVAVDPVLHSPSGFCGVTDVNRLIRFSIVGLLTAAFYFGLLSLIVELALAEPVMASAICYGAAVLLNYLMHYSWTFAPAEDAVSAPHGRALWRYLVMVACGFLINTALMYLMVHVLSWHYLAAQLIALVAVVTWNFLMSNFWVFKA